MTSDNDDDDIDGEEEGSLSFPDLPSNMTCDTDDISNIHCWANIPRAPVPPVILHEVILLWYVLTVLDRLVLFVRREA